MELLQYNAALAITGAIRRTSREKLYQELGLESLHKNRWCINLCYFFKIFKVQSPECLFRIIPTLAKHIIQELMIRFLSLVVSKTFL